MQISVLSVQVTTVPTAKGSYQVADVAFKNLTYGGKVEGKKIMSFGAGKSSFETLATAQPGDVFDVTVVKNDKGYNDWTGMSKGTAGAATAQPAKTTGQASAPVRSTYETPEERAKKQVYIIRQSSISSAIAALSAGAKTPVKVAEAIDYAKSFEAYVLGTGATGFDDVPDFPVSEEFPQEAN